MGKILKKILNAIASFFNKMADQEAERVIEMYKQIFEAKPDNGGGKIMDKQVKGGGRMRKVLHLILVGGFIGLCLGTVPSYAGEVDILLQKLVEKGVLTGAEANKLRLKHRNR